MNLQPKILLDRLRKKIKSISAPIIYAAILMYHTSKQRDMPAWAKRIVIGSLFYPFCLIDAIPYLPPIIGYIDDLGVLTYGFVLIEACIHQEVIFSSRQTLIAWIGQSDENLRSEIDDLLYSFSPSPGILDV